jgi:hypothetical protein
MLNASPLSIESEVLEALVGQCALRKSESPLAQAAAAFPVANVALHTLDDDTAVEWSEEDVVFLHWRLLKEIGGLRDPETPLEAKLDTLRWIFTEREKDSRPFSFVNCLIVVGCSPLSPAPYFGLVDAGSIRDSIRHEIKTWMSATLERYPFWVREAVYKNPEWIVSRLEKNPQWINEQVKKHSVQGDLFA